MVSLTWDDVDARRLARNHLTVPARADDQLGVVRGACGIQAQVLSAAELALSARIPDLRGRRLDVTVEPTTELTATHLELLDLEVARIAAFLDVETTLVRAG